MKFYHILLAVALFTVATSCSKKGESPNTNGNNTTIDDALHLAFKTPEWERHIDCSRLEIAGLRLNDTVRYVSAESESTKEIFHFSYPADSSVMAQANNIKKYKITDYKEYKDGPFQFSQRLPASAGSSTILFSKEGFDDKAYNEIVSVKYVGSSGSWALFQIKARYSMTMYDRDNAASTKLVTGTYHFKVGTYRK